MLFKSVLFLFFGWLIVTEAKSNSELDSLYKTLKQLPPVGRSLKTDTIRVVLLCEVASIQASTDSKKALNNILEAEKICFSRTWEKGLALVNYSKGFHFMSSGKNMYAITFLFKALINAEKTKEFELSGKSYALLGLCYSDLKDFGLAKKYMTLAIQIYKKIENKRLYIEALQYLGLIQFDSKNFLLAKQTFEKCLFECNKEQAFLIKMYCLSGIAHCNKELKNYDEAIRNFKTLQQLENSQKDYPVYDKITTLTNLGDIYRIKKDFNKSKKHLDKALNLHHDGGNDVYSKDLFFTLYHYYKDISDHKNSLFFYEKYISIKENVHEQDIQQQINNLKFEYESSRKDATIAITQNKLQQESRLKKILWGGIVILFVIGCVLWYYSKIVRQKNAKIEAQSLQIVQSNQQLEFLNKNLESLVNERTIDLKKANTELIQKNNQILTALVEGQTIERKRVAVELHDNLGAMLSAMKWRLQIIDKEKLSEKEKSIFEGILSMMERAYAEVRLISHNLLPSELEEKGLLGAIQKLVQDINLSDKLSVIFDYSGYNLQANKRFELELYSICLELVNNILKHSYASKACINLSNTKNELSLKIFDNGIGLNANVDGLKSGVGLSNVKNRVESNHGTMEVISKDSGLEINIKFVL